MTQSLFDLEARRLDGATQKLSDYKGKTLLIVNTASKCGFTPQYKGLETLWEKYKARGLVVLGFPCNQFGSQEPGTETEIGAFCERNYGVTFPLFSKIDVNGPKTHPVFEFLKAKASGVFGTRWIKWNFTKFLVSPDGRIVLRFAPTDKPEDLEGKIREFLGA